MAAAAPPPDFAPYTIIIFNRHGTATRRATGFRAVLANMGGPVGVALTNAGIRTAPTEPARTRATRAGDPYAASRAFQENGGASVLGLMRWYGHQGTKKNAALVVYGPAPADGGWDSPDAPYGMPALDAFEYFDDPEEPFPAHLVSAAIGALVPAWATAGYRLPVPALPAQFRVRCDTMFMTRDANMNLPPARQEGYFGTEILREPYMFRGHQSTCDSVPSLALAMRAYCDAFKTFIDNDLPLQTSNQTFASLVATYVWAFPTNDAAAGGALYGHRTPFLKTPSDPFEVDAVTGLPPQLLVSHGVVPNWPLKDDYSCVARAVMTALHPLHDANSGTNVLHILQNAIAGATALVTANAKRAALTTGSDAVQAQRHQALLDSERARAATQDLFFKTRAAYFASGRVERLPSDPAHRYKSHTKYKDIERSLDLAFRGIHSLMDFRNELWREPVAPDAELLEKLEAAVRPGAQIAFNFWRLSSHAKIAMALGSKHATLAFLLKGGRIINLLFAEHHCYWIRSVSACCNHMILNTATDARTRVGVGAFRILCDICGHAVAKGNVGNRWQLYQHQLRGCTRLPGVLFSAPTSRALKRQLTLQQYPGLMRSLCVAAFDVDASSLGSEGCGFSFQLFVAGDWISADPCDPAWLAFRRRFSFAHSADFDVLRAARPAPLAPLRFETPAAFLAWLTSTGTTEGILGATHYSGPRDARKLVALEKASSSFGAPVQRCYGCLLPMNSANAWDLQEARVCGPVEEEPEADVEEGVPEAEAEADSALEPGAEPDIAPDDDADARTIHAAFGDVCEIPDDVTKTDASPAGPVIHHCHAGGDVWWAHGRCNDAMRQTTNTLTIEVGSSEAMAALVDLVFSRDMIEGPLGGCVPRVSEVDGIVNRLILRVRSSDRGLHEAEKRRSGLTGMDATTARKSRFLTLVFRPADAMLPARAKARKLLQSTRTASAASAASVASPEDFGPHRAATVLHDLLQSSERAFAKFGLWMPAFATQISFSRAVLYRLFAQSEAATGSVATPTSLCSAAQFQDAKRLLLGGRIVIGEAVEWPLRHAFLLDRQAGLWTHRFLFDFTASYPAQMLRWKLPFTEHMDEGAPFFPEETLQSRINALRMWSLDGDFCDRIEISGAFPPELHERLSGLPPLYSKLDVRGSMLSAFQRVYANKGASDSVGLKSVGHFFPVDKHVVFVREAQTLLALGFVFTDIGKMWRTPATFWGKPFAQSMQGLRRDAKAAKDADGEELFKFLSNAVIGSLAVDPGKYTTLLTTKTYDAVGAELVDTPGYMSRRDRILDDPRFTLRAMSAGDCDLYEMHRRSWKHTAHTLAFAFIQAMARCDLLDLYYKDLLPHFQSVKVGYGCTDSLAVELTLSLEDAYKGLKDVRVAVMHHLGDRFDASNIPDTSTVWDHYGPLSSQRRARAAHTAGTWGTLKDETGGAGIAALVVNGPNRWAYRVDTSEPRDCLPKHLTETGADVLKAIPIAWTGRYSIDHFAASWRGEALPVPAELPAAQRMIADSHIALKGALVEQEQHRKAVSLWGNTACIVERTTGRHFPLGSQQPEALAAVAGTTW